MLENKILWWSVGVILGLVIIPGFIFDWGRVFSSKQAAVSFTDCVARNYVVMESYPRQCKDATGQTFVEDIGNTLDKADLISIESPRPGEVISSPLTIVGQARGTWYFEASFPIVLRTLGGEVLVTGHAEALDEWMTNEFVPFKAVLEFGSIAEKDLILELKKDNPSGLPEHDDSVWIPVRLN